MVINLRKHQILVESSIFQAAQEAVAQAGVRAEVQSFELNRAEWVTKLTDFSKSPDQTVVVFPNEWLEDEFDRERAQGLLDLIRSGTLRIGIWGYTPVFPLPFPCVGIVLDRGEDIRSALLIHLSSASFPGVHTVLNPGSFICAERLGSELEIGRSIDRLINNIYQKGVAFKKKSMKVRVAITAALSVAMEELGASAKLNPPTLQIGSSQTRVAISVKWKTKNNSYENWMTLNPPIDLCLKAADAFLVHLLPESNNIELLMVFSEQAPDYEKSPFSIGFDFFTTQRRQSLKDKTGIIQKEEFQYGTFRNLPESVEQKPEASPQSNDPMISSFNALIAGKQGNNPFHTEEDFAPFGDTKLASELKGLKSETERLQVTNKYLEEKVRSLSKALTTVVDAVKTMKEELKKQKDLNAQIEAEKQTLGKEVLESKAREMEAVERMAFCMDIMKALKVRNEELEKKKLAG